MATSTVGWLAQSLHGMQCVRLVTAGALPGSWLARAARCVTTLLASEAAVKSLQFVLTCRPISNPALVKPVAWASVMGVPGKM